ncbi:MAG: hypothetical protein J1F64_06810 [Oscillospiraceae bacterium]|nr:hypothetical protein [Oscillospiraceae bacterium]
MWYLQPDVLLRLLIACGAMILISGISRLLSKKDLGPKFLIFASIAVIAYVSWQLALFSIGYTIVTFILTRILKRLNKKRRLCFVLFSLLCAVPFFYGRLNRFFPQLPVLISFVGIAYNMLKAIDAMYFVYYADMDIEFLTYSNYMLFFPTFTSGPIFRYRDFLKIFHDPVPLTADRFIICTKRFIKGMFKKMVVLYFINTFFAFLLESPPHWYISLSLTVLSYFILFFDLSGYSDIAVATGSVMGYTVPENFRKPWAAASFTQFWRNWHITLSDWVREHILVVMNNKRLNRLASAGMGFTVMFVMDMWHGFALINVIGGIYNGIYLGLENLLGLTTVDKRKMKKPVYVIRCITVNFLFAVNTLMYSVSPDKLFEILRGFITL